jgi:hypothetical protein
MDKEMTEAGMFLVQGQGECYSQTFSVQKRRGGGTNFLVQNASILIKG